MMKADFIKTYHNRCSLYINKESKWLWLRIHKTAGTSMYDNFLRDYCINVNKGEQRTEAIHWAKNITDVELKDYFVWTFVRNPYDRFNSMASMFNKDPNDFAENFEYYIQNSVMFRHTRPQHLFTHHKGQLQADYVGRFESLQADFDVICKKMGVPLHSLGKFNTSNHGHWKNDLDKKTIRFVNKYYEKDFKYFNYKMI